MGYMDQRMKDALDRWITGNYGEDQFKNERRLRERDLEEFSEEKCEGYLDDFGFELDQDEDI